MIQFGTYLKAADNSGAKLLYCIKVLGGSKRRYAKIGDVITASIKEAETGKAVKKKDIVKAVIIRQKTPFRRKDGSYLRFDENEAVLVDGLNARSTRVFGPVPRELRQKGFDSIVALTKYVI